VKNYRNVNFDSVESFKEAVDAYISSHEECKKVMTLNGLAYHLGFSLKTLLNFPDNEFKDTVEYVKSRIAQQAEEKALVSSMHAIAYLERVQPDVWDKTDKIEMSGDSIPKYEIINKLYVKDDDTSES
jgi:hypothetical protein